MEAALSEFQAPNRVSKRKFSDVKSEGLRVLPEAPEG